MRIQGNIALIIKGFWKRKIYDECTNGHSRYKIKLDDFSVDDVNSFEKFLRSEHEIHEKYPEIYQAVPAEPIRREKSLNLNLKETIPSSDFSA